MFTCVANGLVNVKDYDNANSSKGSNEETIEISVAIYTDMKEERCFIIPLKDYIWKVDTSTYYFMPTILSTKDILQGELSIDKYDVLIYSFNQADQYLLRTGFSNLPSNKIIVQNIQNFIKSGGGYYGSCGGAAIAGGMKNEPKSLLERAMKKSSLDISEVEFRYDTAIPLLTEIRGRGPETVDMQAYLFYSGWYVTNPHDMNFSGICPDVNILKDNPIFNDFIEDTRKIRWIGMEGFEVPENPDREIMVLAKFPEEEISDNTSCQIHYWTYTGGISNMIKALFVKDEFVWCKNFGILMRPFLFSTDWKMTDKIVQTDVADKIFMSAEIYPNENQARIVRCSGHPELAVWWGGYLKDVEDTDENNIYKGFYKLHDAIPLDETIEDEFTYNSWIIRRIIAWGAKIPDNDLPPVYGASQVSNIFPYEQPNSFTIIGNTKEEVARKIFLDLYYRYSYDNSSNWTDWTLYQTDEDGSDGWSWEFNAPNGSGYYEFYSIRRVEYEGNTEIEAVPPGPDAIAYVD